MLHNLRWEWEYHWLSISLWAPLSNEQVLFCNYILGILLTCVVLMFLLLEMTGVFDVEYMWHFPLCKNVSSVLTRFQTTAQQYKWLCAGISSDIRRRKETVSRLDSWFSHTNLIKLNNKIQYELIFPLNLLFCPWIHISWLTVKY